MPFSPLRVCNGGSNNCYSAPFSTSLLIISLPSLAGGGAPPFSTFPSPFFFSPFSLCVSEIMRGHRYDSFFFSFGNGSLCLTRHSLTLIYTAQISQTVRRFLMCNFPTFPQISLRDYYYCFLSQRIRIEMNSSPRGSYEMVTKESLMQEGEMIPHVLFLLL